MSHRWQRELKKLDGTQFKAIGAVQRASQLHLDPCHSRGFDMLTRNWNSILKSGDTSPILGERWGVGEFPGPEKYLMCNRFPVGLMIDFISP